MSYTESNLSKIKYEGVLDDKYLNKKLSKEDKKEVVKLYKGKNPDINRELSIKKVFDNIDKIGYIVHKTKNYGIWIFDIKDVTEYMKNNNIEKYAYEVLEKYRKSLNRKEKKVKIKSLSSKKTRVRRFKN